MRTPRRTPGADLPPESAPPTRGRRAHAGPPADEIRGQEPQAGTSVSASGRRRLRPRTVRAKIVSLLMVPVVSLLALWAFATVTTAQDVARQRQLQRVDEQVRTPVAVAVAELQAERRAAVRYLASPKGDRADAVEEQAKRTDKAVDALRLDERHTVAAGAELPDTVVSRLDTFVSGAQNLRTLRTGILDRSAAWDKTYDQYTRTIQEAFGVTGALTGIHDARLGSDARVLLEFARAGEMLAREDALLSSAQRTRTFDVKRQRQFAGAVETRRHLTEAAADDLPDTEHEAWRALSKKGAYDDVLAAEDKVIAAPPGRKAAQAVPEATWKTAHTAVQRGVRAIGAGTGGNAADRTDPLAQGVLTPSGAAVLLGLGAVAASLVISVRIGRGLVVELVSLRNGALEIARRKLPHAMQRLRAGEEIDVNAEAPQEPPADDEIGQVAEALATVHRAAVGAAVERAELANGVSGIFVNLARRSQVLVHRQLNLLDTMERRADDPSELGDLFRLDHLTTRMRRHAESLIILSGAAPGRAWRMPVPLTNVVRAAVSEIEDYARVEVRILPEAAVVGATVADLTHLLAELVENAAQFSPPHTKVRVSGEPVGNGYALEIEDRGLGMGKESLAEANRRIEQSEALDLFDSDRLGLFVVSRLASRHGIKVHLRTSPYGGTTAVVLLPIPLLQSAVTKAGRTPAPEPGPARTNGTAFPAPAPAPAPRPVLAAQPHPHPRPEEAAGVTSLRLHKSRPTERTESGDTDPHGTRNGEDGLPRRVRQASLVPQLREAPPPEPPSPRPPSGENAQERTPEQARDRMTAYRSGWTRGSEGDHA
ncbi:sensor histidine kinase [Streptomyces sp. ISL-98]|uniref:sensor histidine kinase n=1 Tax=Streptomyces sp. ISL-98 TaxID=2819192 RepID=UPI001BE78E0E|nr:sensor histidine kinase [Streptomyces sp. ISL-98]MBT2507821.1 sensor histidine kinase [Streptomyces sp. ISL-98]